MGDLKGMKIRTTGLNAKIVEALGGVPVALTQGGRSRKKSNFCVVLHFAIIQRTISTPHDCKICTP